MKYELVGVRNGVELYNPVAENAAEERAEGADIFLDYLSDQSKFMSVLYRTQIS